MIVEPSSTMPCSRSSRLIRCVSAPSSFAYPDLGDSSPSQMDEMPSSTNSSQLYFRMAFAEEKMCNDQLFPAAFIQASSSMARRFWSRKFSSMMKNDFTWRDASASSINRNSSSPVE